MITASNIQTLESMLEKAKKRCEEINPELEIIETGLYHVKGSKGNWYEVRCGITADNQLFISCQCRGSLESKPCFHSWKAFFVHTKIRTLEIENKKRENDEKNPTYLPPTPEKKTEKLGNYHI